MKISFARAALVLGVLSSGGPIATDTYLPALPSISGDIGATPGQVQMTLMAYFLAVALFQPVYGPLSDMFGRKPPLFAGVILFTLASVGVAFAPNIETLIALRFVQGVGGCAAMIIPRAVVRDLYTGVMAARLMALVMLVFSMGPILAPFIGSVITELAGWRMVFIFIALLGVLSLTVLATALPETRGPEKRAGASFRNTLANYAELLGDRRFIATALIGAGGMASFFTFVSASSFVYIDHFGFTSMQYSIAFSFNAVGFFACAQLNGYFGARYGLPRQVRTAVTVFWTMFALLSAYFLLGGGNVWVMIGGMFLGFSALGLVIPGAAVLALDRYGHSAGTASSLMGTIQFSLGALAIVISSLAGQGSPVPMIVTILGFATLATTMAFLVLNRHEPMAARTGAAVRVMLV